jgi:hypothetical protein
MAEQDNQPPEDKNKVGRPLAYGSVEELQVAIDSYFAMCDPHIEEQIVESGMDNKGQTIFMKRKVMTAQRPYNMSGLARACGVDRRTILNYSNKEEFFPTIDDARARCEEYWEGRLDSPFSNGAKFNLSNNYDGWADKKEIDHTTQGHPILGGTTPLADEDDDQDQADDPADE